MNKNLNEKEILSSIKSDTNTNIKMINNGKSF